MNVRMLKYKMAFAEPNFCQPEFSEYVKRGPDSEWVAPFNDAVMKALCSTPTPPPFRTTLIPGLKVITDHSFMVDNVILTPSYGCSMVCFDVISDGIEALCSISFP